MATELTARREGESGRKQDAFWFYGDLVIVHVAGEETRRRFCLVE